MTLIEQIGRGGFARVEKVRLDDGRICAKKVFDPRPDYMVNVTREKLLSRFGREVRTQKNLPSDYFFPIYEADLEATEPWFTMPLADGILNKEILSKRHNPESLYGALADVLNALEALHALGLSHRDLSPSNILLHGNKWKLADFGLVAAGPGETIVSSHTVYGTQPYLSPEQWLDFHSSTPATDIYAFGCILHDIFDGDLRIPHRQYTSTGMVAPIIERCTNEEPSNRYANVSSLRAALFTALRSPIQGPTSRNASNWIDMMAHAETWETGTIVGFGGFLRAQCSDEDFNAIVAHTTDEFLKNLATKDQKTWKNFILKYCDWADGGHAFEFCDVVGQRLVTIFDHGDMSDKAAALIAMAELGEKNNRWYVMKLLLARTGPQMDENLARRLAIEIRGVQCEYAFRRCSDEIGRDNLDGYHPTVRDACGPIVDY